MNIAGKTALVTASSKGIGQATARALGKEGAKVIINFMSDEKAAVETAGKCGQGSIAIKADVTNAQEVKAMFVKIKDTFGALDILVNNAGLYESAENITDTNLLDKMYRYNLASMVSVTHEALPIMKGGKIVNISSLYGKLDEGIPEGAAYAAAKAGVESYTKTLAKALAPRILVNAIEPGYTLTTHWGVLSETDKAKYAKSLLINRFIEPHEIAETVIFLIRNDAITGEVVLVDGGMSLKK